MERTISASSCVEASLSLIQFVESSCARHIVDSCASRGPSMRYVGSGFRSLMKVSSLLTSLLSFSSCSDDIRAYTKIGLSLTSSEYRFIASWLV